MSAITIRYGVNALGTPNIEYLARTMAVEDPYSGQDPVAGRHLA
jgi:hypothetical protein